MNREIIVSILMIVVLVYGLQGMSYGLDDPHGIALDVAGGKMYWTDDSADRIQRANLDGSNVENLIIQGLIDPYGIALDVAGGKMYWADEGANRIQRANLDGSNVETLVSRGLDDPHDIALDVAGGKMYWTDDSADRIQRANLDGSNVETLVRFTRRNFFGFTTSYGDPYGIALDVAGGKMYWADEGENKIYRANLNGSNIETLVSRGLRDPHGIALDVAGGKMYWTDDSADRIQRANLDGSNIENLITQGLIDPYGIALDVAGGKMYWADEGANKIQRANLDGSNIETLVPHELKKPHGIVSQVPPIIAMEDVNRDGTVNILDLVLIASNLGQTGENPADVNGDGVVNIRDLVLVAGVLEDAAAAPSLHLHALEMLTSADVKAWLSEVQQLGLTDTTSQRGILFLETFLAAMVPKETVLLANYPNPFNPETWIPYQLAKPADVKVSIYATDGALVRTLALGHQAIGVYQSRGRAAYWDGRNALGEPVASGVYFYTLTAGEFIATRRMLILK